MAKKNNIVQAKSFAEFWAAIPVFVKIIIWALVAFLIYLIGKAIYKSYKEAKRQKLLEGNQVTTTFNSPTTGQPITQTVDLGTKAAAIDAAFYENDWFGISEDEEAAITELLGVPKNLIPDLSNVYFKLNGKNLKSDFLKFAPEQWPSISYLFQ